MLIPASGRPPVYIRPVQFAISLMWGLAFVCSEAGDYLAYILGRPNHPRYRIFDVLFRRYQEDCDRMHRFTHGLNAADLVGTGFEKLKGNRSQFTSVGIWGQWAEDAYVRGWVARYADMYPGFGWEDGSVPRPIGMPPSAAGPDIFSDDRSDLSQIPRTFRYEHWEVIQRAETWWRMVFEASPSELQAGEVRTWARGNRLWQVAPFVAAPAAAPVAVPAAAPVAVPAVAPVVAPAAASGSDSGDRSVAESDRDGSPRRGGAEVSIRSEAPELGSAVDGVSSMARERRGERTVHPGIRALLDGR